MSAKALSKLSLGDTMVMTRAQASAARARTSSLHTPQQSPRQSPSSSEASSPTSSLIESTYGLKYNVSAFDDDVRKRAKIGLMDDNEIKMKYCRRSTDDRMKYTFYIDDDITVAMGGSYTVPKCSCGANEGGKACKHIFWMLNQLTEMAPEHIKSRTLELAVDGSRVQDFEPSIMIDRIKLDELADNFDWPVHNQSPEARDVQDDIADMLSVFEPSGALPAEAKDASLCPSERSQKFREFRDLFTRYATENLGMYIRLRELLDPEFQTQVFFEKIDDRTTRAFRGLEEYIAHGPTADAHTECYDIVTCAEKLKALVKAIGDYYHQKAEEAEEAEDDEDDEDTEDIAIRAAAALINILDGVASRNRDAYANITWGGLPPVEPAMNNLFANLIGAPTGDDDGLFVLDTLKALPHEDVLRNHWAVLLDLNEKLAQQWPPPVYMDAFCAITQERRKRAASETSETAGHAKRTMQ
ncbi:hypothetical protein K504DRAFT_476443 [Pleomassaria siparia CBS 279.74]|uniref:SWIM-type domain-containing protein n=1 Tax=Pleomassaria siparia CBS 279.74 TaxID=1314801 RepID=A0A6G1KCE8_9PLEO|nr:hypothetical protein K504DRAFT_476443 [Pleomassaria siparia CBS 279.74]